VEEAAKSLGFIALSEIPMNWENAKTFCKEKGGRLPLIGGSDSLAANDARKEGIPIDGFGTVGARWPASLPNAVYWTGTEFSIGPAPGHSWRVNNRSGNVRVAYGPQSLTVRVVCVP